MGDDGGTARRASRLRREMKLWFRTSAWSITSSIACAMMSLMNSSMRWRVPRPSLMADRICLLSSSLEAPHSSTRSTSILLAIANGTSTASQDSSPMTPAAVANLNGKCCWCISSSSKRHQTRCSGCTSGSKTMTTSRTSPPRRTFANALSSRLVPSAASTSHWLLEKEQIQYTSSLQDEFPPTDSACWRIAATKSAKCAPQECETK
mmetsp:Transcript_34673/g.89013  ORF Transcript_34673/g.89013 Transcript_34673/m.89013 type:complete len:207 (-) Transcript_34673:897-1517(-)